MSLNIRPLTGAELDAALDDVARLRIAVFREWPYLYDGDLDYERRYLDHYRNSSDAVLVGAFEGSRLVGAATGAPMQDHAEDFSAAFDRTDIGLDDLFYCAESVLLPEYRGQGAGHAFFDHREGHARDLGLSLSCFCAVIRPDDHPLRPKSVWSLEPFWRGRGYAPLQGVTAKFSWKDVGDAGESDKSLQFWMRRL